MPNDLLQIVADNPALLNAVKATILKQFEFTFDAGADDAQIGQVTRAVLMGRDKIEAAFKDIERYQSVPVRKETQNPAR